MGAGRPSELFEQGGHLGRRSVRGASSSRSSLSASQIAKCDGRRAGKAQNIPNVVETAGCLSVVPNRAKPKLCLRSDLCSSWSCRHRPALCKVSVKMLPELKVCQLACIVGRGLNVAEPIQ